MSIEVVAHGKHALSRMVGGRVEEFADVAVAVEDGVGRVVKSRHGVDDGKHRLRLVGVVQVELPLDPEAWDLPGGATAEDVIEAARARYIGQGGLLTEYGLDAIYDGIDELPTKGYVLQGPFPKEG